MGIPIIVAMKICVAVVLKSNFATSDIPAPNTFRIPISFVLSTVLLAIIPSIPRHAIPIAIQVKNRI